MSIAKKIQRAAEIAATEAVARERARCLYVLDQLVQHVDEDLKKKLLIESQRHAVQVKQQICHVVVNQAKRGIISGLRPTVSLNVLTREPVHDMDEMQRRVTDLIDTLDTLGFAGVGSLDDVKKQIKTWEEQEDLIDELQAKLDET